MAGCEWLSEVMHQTGFFHSHKMITAQAALLAVMGMNTRFTWKNQSFLIADNTLNKA